VFALWRLIMGRLPYDCDLRPFTPEDFCKALGGRGVLVVGDSLSKVQANRCRDPCPSRL
jgi:hypothetical protein